MTPADQMQHLGFVVEDEWFNRWHTPRLTPEFCQWWIREMGSIEQFMKCDSLFGDHEYFVNMGFALMGWLARDGDPLPVAEPEKPE